MRARLAVLAVLPVVLGGCGLLSGEAPGSDLEVGQCFDLSGDVGDTPEGEAGELTGVDEKECDEPHDGEAFAVFQAADVGLTGDDYPGDAAVQQAGDARCFEEFEPYVGLPVEQSRWDYLVLFPSEQTWAADDRRFTCVADLGADGPKAETSARGSDE